MKKTLISLLVLSFLLAVLTACGAQAMQPEAPESEPAPQVEKTEPAKAEPLSEVEKTEISLEDLETIFEEVYTTASGSHPEDWSTDFQITDELGKIKNAIPDDKIAPSDLRSIYTDWRTARTEAEEPEEAPAPEPEEPEEAPIAQQPTTPVEISNTTSTNDTSSSSDDWRQNMIIGGEGQGLLDSEVTPGDPNNISGTIILL